MSMKIWKSKQWLVMLIGLAGANCLLAQDWFEDRTLKSGINFRHVNGMTGDFHFPEILGSGAALFDLEGDGDLDLYLVQSGLFDVADRHALIFADDAKAAQGDRLYRNDTPVDSPDAWRFTDVTASAGIADDGYGFGVASGDLDNDGDLDLYITQLGANRLLRNNGDGTMTDITAASGTAGDAWSTSAAFFDFDRDGLLDLYVTNYVVYTHGDEPNCYAKSSAKDYCGPDAFTAAVDRLYRNRGNGRFEDVTARIKGTDLRGAGLGVIAADFDLDGWLDIYVANDGDANFLLLNQAGESFRDEALLSGTAVNGVGAAEASMGVTAADFDGDGDEDLFMTHLMGETNTLYVNDGNLVFEDRTDRFGLGAASRRYTAFGTLWFDYDLDGWLDLLVLNGAVRVPGDYSGQRSKYPLDEPNQLFHNRDGLRFDEVTSMAGSIFKRSHVSRGAAFGDLDNDGDVDVVLVNNQGPVELLANRFPNPGHWLGMQLLGPHGGRHALGTRVAVLIPARKPIWRTVRTDGSFLSAQDPRLLVGLGSHDGAVKVRVEWLTGQPELFDVAAVDRYVSFKQGKGREVQQ